jgi:purine-nucleoside phosphorylase
VSGIASPGTETAAAIASAVRQRFDREPVAAIVLGSGLGESIRVARELAGSSEGTEISYAELPGFPPPSVPGHAGRLWLGELGERTIAVFQGRIHFYEGHGMALASITSQIAAELGARTMALTTAVGALDRALVPGAVVVITDHVNLMGTNPLLGWRMADGAPAFVDVSAVYDAELSAAALSAARDHLGDTGDGTRSDEGVYGAVSGPSYETPSESEFLRRSGATVVGMSMVPEAVAARALGMRVLGLSFVTNAAGTSTSHEEVLLASKTAADVIGRILADVVPML